MVDDQSKCLKIYPGGKRRLDSERGRGAWRRRLTSAGGERQGDEGGDERSRSLRSGKDHSSQMTACLVDRQDSARRVIEP
jgi:hypothetical protein